MVRQSELPPRAGMRSAMGSMRSMIMAASLTVPGAAASVFVDPGGEYRMAADTFTTRDGIRLAYYVDDFTDPWRQADTLLLLHAAVGHARRFYAWGPPLCR